MVEIKKTIQDMNEEIKKDVETLKNNQSEINNSISQTNITIKSLVNRVEQIENSIRNRRQSRGIRPNSKRSWKEF
jgi:predicted  nucleic acid-binding Zn-ribbon protein